MSAGDPPSAVCDDRDQGRFVVKENGAVAELVYETEPGRLILGHTEVPEVLGGRGVGAQIGTGGGGPRRGRGAGRGAVVSIRPPMAGRPPRRRRHRDDRLGDATPAAMNATRASS